MSVIIQYPTTSPTDTLTLPNPKIGNSRSLNINSRFQMAMSGKTYSYIKTPVTQKLFMVFDNLTATHITNILAFIKDFGYKTLRLTNWDSVSWDGKITNNPLEMIKPNKGFFSMALEFEGEVV
jgi:hypothetical protein